MIRAVRFAAVLSLVGLIARSAWSAAPAPKTPPVESAAASAPTPDPGAVTLLGRYRGTLPCADCSGIRTELTLYREAALGAPAAYALRETYLGVAGDERTIESVGRWRILQGTPKDPDATVYQLAFDRPEHARSFLRVDSRTLRSLDRALNELGGEPRPTLSLEVPGGNTSSDAEGGVGAISAYHPAVARGETPRKAVLGYLVAARAGDDETAATYLDLSTIPESDRAELGPVLARHLKIVLDQTLWFGDLDDLSDDTQGWTNDGLPEDRDRAGSIKTSSGTVDIRLRRIANPDGSAVWKFAHGTVERIPALYDEFGIGWAGDYLPRWTYSTRFGEVELWQWVALPILVLLALAFAWFVTPMVSRLLSHGTRRTRTATDDRLLEASTRPLHAFIALVLFTSGVHALHLSIPASRVVGDVTRVLFVLATTWWVVRLIDALAESARLHLLAEGRAAAIGAVTLGRRLAKVAICLLAVVVLLQQTDFRVSGLLAGLGVGGLAAGLGAQRSVANLLGGITLAMDQAFRVGDLCRVGDVYGTVEEIGFRSTRIRTLDRTVVTVPNAQMSDARIENYAMRDSMRLLTTVALRGDTTPDQLNQVASGVRKMLAVHSRVLPQKLRVRLVQIGAGTLDVEINAYVSTTDLDEFLGIREEILLKIVDVIAASGAVIANPVAVMGPTSPSRAGGSV